jgi:predicted nucleic acid-binding protein
MNCLGSSFLVDFLDSEGQHHDAAVQWMNAHSNETLATPAICAFEVLRGSARGDGDQFDRAVGFLRTLTILDLTLDTAIAAGRFDGKRHAAGEPLSPRDTLVASAARTNSATLITRDSDFENVPDLNVVAYTDS